MKKLTIIYLLGIVTLSESLAQTDFRDGFIVTLKNDTIFGQVDYRTNFGNYKSAVFREGNEITTFSPDQIGGYGFHNDKYFSSTILEGSFVEVIILGELSLFKSRSKFLVGKDTVVFSNPIYHWY